jgi:lipopolysaccharide export system protein LptC
MPKNTPPNLTLPAKPLTAIKSADLERINPLLLPLPWLVVVVLVIVFAAMKYTSSEDATPTLQAAAEKFPYTYLTEVEVRHYDHTGQLQYQMNSPLIRSFQIEAAASAKDYSLFETPVFILVNDPKKPGWLVTAQAGRLDNNNEWFSLLQEVVARQTSEKQGEITITTSDLRLNTREQFAETSKAVIMRTAKSQINATGMRADIKRDYVQLLSNVKGTYEP